MVYIGHGRLDSITMPAAWTAAGLSFQGTVDGVNFFNVFDNAGNEVVVNAAANEQISIDRFEGAVWIKIRSGTNAAPVNQAVAAALTLLVRKFPLVRT